MATMAEPVPVSVRRADQDSADPADGAEARDGQPATLPPLPVERDAAGLKVLLDDLFREKLSLGRWKFDRDELYDR
jgi:hypothetical protein